MESPLPRQLSLQGLVLQYLLDRLASWSLKNSLKLEVERTRLLNHLVQGNIPCPVFLAVAGSYNSHFELKMEDSEGMFLKCSFYEPATAKKTYELKVWYSLVRGFFVNTASANWFDNVTISHDMPCHVTMFFLKHFW